MTASDCAATNLQALSPTAEFCPPFATALGPNRDTNHEAAQQRFRIRKRVNEKPSTGGVNPDRGLSTKTQWGPLDNDITRTCSSDQPGRHGQRDGTTKTMGIVVVAALAANTEGKVPVAITATRRCHQVRRQRRQPIDLIVGAAVFDGHVLALDEARVSQALADHRHRRLLRASHERPRSRRAAEKRDELAPFIKKLAGHEAVATGLSSTEKPSSARRLTSRRACVSGRRRSKWVEPRSL